MKLPHKALILVAIPLTFELLFVSVLGFLLFEVERNARVTEKSRNLVLETENLQRMFYEAGVAIAGYNATKNPLFTAQFDEAKNKIRMQLALIGKLSNFDDRASNKVVEIEKLVNKEIKLLDRLHDQMDRGELIGTSPYEGLQDLSIRLSNLFESIIDKEREISKDAPEAENRLRSLVEQWLLCGVIVNICLAFGLAIHFNRGTARRLQVLMQNTSRVVSEEALLPSIGGNDEIAELDRRFREMSESVTLARRNERAVVENALDVICSINEDGQFTAVNPSSFANWGYTEDELLGKPIKKILLAEGDPSQPHPLERTIKEKSTATIEARIRRKDGQPTDSLWSMHWSKEENAFFCVVHDMSERKRAEQMRRDIVAMVSHDIRTPLTSITIGQEILTSGARGELPEKAKEELAKIGMSAQRLMRLVNDFLDMEKIQSQKLELIKRRVNLDVLINNSVKELSLLASTRGISMTFDESDLDILADGERLIQVIVNLLSNAIKYSPNDSKIRLEATVIGGDVEVRVIDHGPGIDLDSQAVIFERFKQLEGSIASNSSGLGLAICKSLVELHGGTIGVRSLPGVGSTFWFRIPLNIDE
ncbi:MAG: PAS domain S-box protein [Cyanobacteria bacterium]|nr:PAS domain S-box protein [Cyanobacteriota bacterium]